jgi:hypothetical protein
VCVYKTLFGRVSSPFCFVISLLIWISKCILRNYIKKWDGYCFFFLNSIIHNRLNWAIWSVLNDRTVCEMVIHRLSFVYKKRLVLCDKKAPKLVLVVLMVASFWNFWNHPCSTYLVFLIDHLSISDCVPTKTEKNHKHKLNRNQPAKIEIFPFFIDEFHSIISRINYEKPKSDD